MCIYDLPNALTCREKFFADDVSLFFVFNYTQESAKKKKKILETTNRWAVQWELLINPDANKMGKNLLS